METRTEARGRRRRISVLVGASMAGAAALSALVGTLPARGDTPPPDLPTTPTTVAPDLPTTTTTIPSPPALPPGSPDGGSTTAPPPPPTYTTVLAPPDAGGGTGGGGFSGGGGSGTTPTTTVPTSATSPATVGPGGIVWSDAPGTAPSSSNPLVVAVDTPTGGAVTIAKTGAQSVPTGYSVLGMGAQITAPQASASSPLTLTFNVAVSALPSGDLGGDTVVFRDGAPVQPCASSTATSAQPDPCVTTEAISAGSVVITVLSSHASTWALATPSTPRLAGSDREGTAVAVSQASFSTGTARAVVLARDDAYPDALAGAPLAVAQGGPLLLTSPGTLDAPVAAELARVLPAGGTVYLLGGTAALSDTVARQVQAAGFQVTRLAGADRYATAAAVAGAVSGPTTVLETTGLDFPDALAAATAAPKMHAVILLTDGSTQSAAATQWLGSHPGVTRYAVGGPAAHADPAATAVVGGDRYATAALLATRSFPGANAAGLASGTNFPDALAAAARLGRLGEPLLLTGASSLPQPDSSYLSSSHTSRVEVFGGTAAVSDAVLSALHSVLG